MQSHNNDNTKTSLFREKSLEAIESPESLNDYLRVTSPGVWLVLGAVIALLAGFILWGVFGRITTTQALAVVSQSGQATCYVPYTAANDVLAAGTITLDGQDYAIAATQDAAVTVVTDDFSSMVRMVGGISVGDVIIELPLAADLPDGVYTATAVTESIQPISLLLQ